MSHSKNTKKGRSQYVEVWNPRAKKFILQCSRCGYRGYSAEILNDEFQADLERRAISRELQKILRPLELDGQGFCASCGAIPSEDNSDP